MRHNTHPPLLTLPLELRHKIYTHLLTVSTTYNPIATVGLTSASHAPPGSNLVNITPQLTAEILDFYHAITC